MGAMASQITSVSIVYLSVCLPVNSHHNEPIKRKMFPLDSVIMYMYYDLMVLAGFGGISTEQKTLYKMADEISPKVDFWGRDKIAAISRTIFRLRFHWFFSWGSN